MELSTLTLVLLAFLAGLGLGMIFVRSLSKMNKNNENEALENRLKVMATTALKSNNESFLQLAEQKFKNLHQQSESGLEKHEKNIENLVKPIREIMEKTSEQMHNIEKQRKEEYGSLQKQIEMTMDAQQNLRKETGRLARALKQPQVRGRWGEMTLRRLAELAGMVEHCDFEEQVSTEDQAGNRLRPDMIVKMPNERIIIVDAKASINSYLEAFEAEDDSERESCLEKHARNMSERVKELSTKAYWKQFEHALDFVILFVPGDQFLAAALQKKPDLIDQAMKNRIILATPSSLVAVLRAVAFGWREKSLAENATKIQELGKSLYERIGVFVGHFQAIGKNLNDSVINYNKAQSSMENRLISSANKLAELGIPKTKDLNNTSPLDNHPNPPTKLVNSIDSEPPPKTEE